MSTQRQAIVALDKTPRGLRAVHASFGGVDPDGVAGHGDEGAAALLAERRGFVMLGVVYRESGEYGEGTGELDVHWAEGAGRVSRRGAQRAERVTYLPIGQAARGAGKPVRVACRL